MGQQSSGWSVSGPDADRSGIAGRGPAVSYAQGRAVRHMDAETVQSYYVRDPQGIARVRVEAGRGAVVTLAAGAL